VGSLSGGGVRSFFQFLIIESSDLGKSTSTKRFKKNLTSSVSDIKIERSSAFLTTFYKKKKKEKLLSSSQKVTVPSEFFFI